MTMHIVSAEFASAVSNLDQLPPPVGFEVAFAGRSNVGKSSLINRLVNRKKLVRTSSTPGCTRAINFFHVVTRESAFEFVDLPGYGYARRSKEERRSWGPLIEGFLEQRTNLQAVVVIVDVRRGVEPEDAQLLEFLKHLGRRALLVATKIDKLPSSQRKTHVLKIQRASGVPAIGFSAVSGEGSDALWAKLMPRAV